jgi:hypothetical protein
MGAADPRRVRPALSPAVWGASGRFPLRLNATQDGFGNATGTWTIPGTIVSGELARDATNRTDINGKVILRFKVTSRIQAGGFDDFRFEGQLQPDGRTMTGGVQGSGFRGEPFTLTR